MATVIFAIGYLSYHSFKAYRKKRADKAHERSIMTDGKETLREKATRKLHGGNGEKPNPSMLGDPVSLKAETSPTVPTENEEGAHNGAGQVAPRVMERAESVKSEASTLLPTPTEGEVEEKGEMKSKL